MHFGRSSNGIRLAWLTRSAAGCVGAVLCGLLMSTCLVTDTIDLPPEPHSAPQILARDYAGTIIQFDSTKYTQLRIPFDVRDEDTDEELQMRWRVRRSQTSSATADTSELDYPCPETQENAIAGGSLYRNDNYLQIDATKFPRGSCSRVELVVSASFRDCTRNPDEFDVTANQDNEEDLGRATFWVWETSTGALTNPAQAQQLLSSCISIPYTPSTTVTGNGVSSSAGTTGR
jgi:hypothetical protein